jgi:hypothetical protein
MPARRFRLVFEDGATFHCAAFEHAYELEQLLAPTMPTPGGQPTMAPPDSPRPVGRPSHHRLIAAAIETMGASMPKPGAPLAEQVRAVLKQLALHYSGSQIPSSSTVERWLRQNSRQKSRQNSRRGSIASHGRAKVSEKAQRRARRLNQDRTAARNLVR